MTSQEADASPLQRVCQHCQNAYPITHFRPRTQSGSARMKQCRLCHNQSERLRRQYRRRRLTSRQFHQHLTSLKNQRTARGVERVFLDLVEQFGGTDGLVKTWMGAIEKDIAEGGFRAYRHIASIIRLMQHCENSRPDKPDYSTMTDEELERAIGELGGQLEAP